MNEGIFDKWREFIANWRKKRPGGDYVDAKSPHGAAKPKDRGGVYISPEEIPGKPGELDIPQAMAKIDSDLPHLNYKSDAEEKIPPVKKAPSTAHLTDFEGARTMTKWEDEEKKEREESWRQGKEEFDAIKAVQPTLDIDIYHPGKKIRNLKESIRIIFKNKK